MGHLGWLFKLNLHPRHQHCTDEAQKAETVLSAVSYFFHIDIYIYIYLLGALEISPPFLYFVKLLMYILKGQDVRDAG